MPPGDMHVIYQDDSGVNAEPLPGFEGMGPKARLFHNQHRDLHNLLSGSALDDMAARFVDIYSKQISESDSLPQSQVGWTQIPDFYALLRDEMFRAATVALLGDHFFRLNPKFSGAFWEFGSCDLSYVRNFPRWMARKTYQVCDEALDSLKLWRDHTSLHHPITPPADTEAEWEPYWGAKFMRAREIMFNDPNLSPRGKAAFDLGMIWATNANAIPPTFWALRSICLTPGLTSRVLAETRSGFDAHTGALGQWKFERGSTLIANIWLGNRAPNFWNTGHDVPSGKQEHPVESFWAEQFLEYSDDPSSGPLRKADVSVYRDAAGAERKPKTVEDDRKAKVVTTGTAGYFFPYGGGTKICPGRHFAKQEMMAAVTVFMREFEVEIVDAKAAERVGLAMGYFPAGSLPPDGKMPVRMRRRGRS
ncbi:cytochrome P450 [Immersiella caudata]|uniref:Cytochrome P450 n=1 Tax=Immersiella caudata TaxID=314043 RepID=A0AA39WBX0_9PEZI|nr:cytochrome P450 [Immersiella caudata]